MLLELARHYGLDRAAEERWLALAGHLPTDVERALLAYPDRWDDVRVLLGLRGSGDGP